jgi:chorismate--pyruvate lyase
MEARPTHWRPRFLLPAVPEGLRSRLLARGSLTRTLRRDCPGRLAVCVLRHDWIRPESAELRQLGRRARGRLLVREVLLHCDARPWVYARSVIPESSLRGPLARLRGLGARPLADVLFSVPRVHRGPMEYALLAPGEALHERAAAAVGGEASLPPLWARRSRFTLEGRPLLVTEVFLPEAAA